MPLLPATLASGLESLEPTDKEIDFINGFTDAWKTYMEGSMAGPVPAIPGSFAGAISTMKGAMSGVSADGAGANIIQAAITAFWGVVASSAASIWPPATAATPPPGLGGIGAALTGVFAANTSGQLDLSAAVQAIAGAIHPTQLGGMAIFPPPPTGIGPQPIT